MTLMGARSTRAPRVDSTTLISIVDAKFTSVTLPAAGWETSRSATNQRQADGQRERMSRAIRLFLLQKGWMPAYSTIDGDISDFFDALMDMTTTFQTEELRRYLLNDGDLEEDVDAAIRSWQADRFEPLDPEWESFRLTDAGRKAVEELRDSLD